MAKKKQKDASEVNWLQIFNVTTNRAVENVSENLAFVAKQEIQISFFQLMLATLSWADQP